jgi:hypothetical protein
MTCLLEVRVTISPTPFFFRRIHFMAASLAVLGGALASHEIVVSVGGGDGLENYYRSQPWSNAYPITWRQVPPASYLQLGYRATNRDRAAHMARGELVMLADADVIFLRDFAPLLDEIIRAPAICGVMAHVSPFRVAPPLMPSYAGRDVGVSSADYWALLGHHFDVPNLTLQHELSGWHVMCGNPLHRFAPAYYNGGMVLGPSDLMEQMLAQYGQAETAVAEVMETYFLPQIARTLAIYKGNLPRRTLPLRYNFPNDPAFDLAYPQELADIAVLHYLRKDVVHRDEDFADPASVARLMARTDLSGSNEVLRRRISELCSMVWAGEQLGRC